MLKNITQGVAVWEEDVIIPTYEVGIPDKNPMFLEKRVYQGSSGKVYPHSVIDKISDEKVDKVYKAVFLENKYLHIMILPELGGKIQRALDKTNNYDFVYYNKVIKPALVGLNGPWISGGIEFNWPQHHRPSTFDPVSYKMVNHVDGSCSVYVGEIENMFRTKGMARFTLYPDTSYIEINAQLFNRTDDMQTFLWWANPAIAVNDYTQSIFPPDVHAVMDHGKRDVSKFPIATGVYYKQDYSAGVDISRYKNIPVPTSYMAYKSDYNFVGGYDYGVEAGILHVADHHVSPGKKQWTWGNGDFGQAWDRNLTDDDGPYIELMTGCFTDNQPDFTWLSPYEEKVFTQCFMPYKKVGKIHNATINAAVNLSLEGNKLSTIVYATKEFSSAKVIIKQNKEIVLEKVTDLSPVLVFEESIVVNSTNETDYTIEVFDENGKLLVDYTPKEKVVEEMPEPAKPAPAPEDCRTTEELLLYGKHLEQYRHATFEPADYYLEGLKRDSNDIRLNTAYGALLMRRGMAQEAQKYFETAIKRQTLCSPQPYDGEALYNLGVCLQRQNKLQKAYDAFYKATWNAAWQDSSFYKLACIASIYGEYETALEHIEHSLVRNIHNMKARGLKTMLLRKLGKCELALSFANESIEIDMLDIIARNEIALLTNNDKTNLFNVIAGNHNTLIELSLEYSDSGFYVEANEVISSFIEIIDNDFKVYPMLFYYMAANFKKLGNEEDTNKYLNKAANACSDYCFPHRIDDIFVLEFAIRENENDSKAPYYLGCLYYDKKQYEKAIELWEKSISLDDKFPTAHRNLSIAYFNKNDDKAKAKEELEKAFALNQSDARVFMELDQLYKKIGFTPEKRLEIFENHVDLLLLRDDLYLEYVTLINMKGEFERALKLIEKHKFHPWEGGEGRVPSQYVFSNVELAKKAIKAQDYKRAIELLSNATVYPHNLGEGKLAGAQENNIYYYMGCAYEGLNDYDKANECFKKASSGLSEPTGMMYYNDQPPEMIFYQGLALEKLGDMTAAKSRFNKLISYGEKHIFDKVKIEYFAVSLPDIMIFDENLDVKNEIHCLYMMALGNLGLKNMKKAKEQLYRAQMLDKNHIGVMKSVEML